MGWELEFGHKWWQPAAYRVNVDNLVYAQSTTISLHDLLHDLPQLFPRHLQLVLQAPLALGGTLLAALGLLRVLAIELARVLVFGVTLNLGVV